MFKEYDTVYLAKPAKGIPVGTKGTVLIVYDASPPAFEVELFDDEDVSLGTFTLMGDLLEARLR